MIQSKIAYNTFLGKLLRLPLALIPRTTTVRILRGLLRGKKWIIGAGMHSYWLGTFEAEKQKILLENIKEGFVFYDLGAHTGYYSLQASMLVGKNGMVYAFEPNPRNISYLKQHFAINKIENVSIVQAAVGDQEGMLPFKLGTTSFVGQVSKDGDFFVKVLSLDSSVAHGDFKKPDFIKIDVEGAELSVLTGARSVLEKYHPYLLLSLHSQDLLTECLSFLAPFRYTITALDNQPIGKSRELFLTTL
jgi:FkbM family methyltransferase